MPLMVYCWFLCNETIQIKQFDTVIELTLCIFNHYRIMFLTLSVNIKNKKILFIGSGRIAEHKIKNVINYEPSICVIGIEATDYILNLNKNNMISYYKREFNEDDIKNDYFMVFAATNNSELNKNISVLCKNKNILCDNVSDHNYSDVITPVNIRIDCIDISINTNGEEPGLTKELKNLLLDDIINNNYNFEKKIKEIYDKKMRGYENNRK